MKNRVAACAAVLAAGAYLAGCPPSQKNIPEKNAQAAHTLKIGVILAEADSPRWAAWDEEPFTRTILEAGGSVVKITVGPDASKQLEQSQALLEEGLQVLAVLPRHIPTASRIIEAAHMKNIPVLAYDAMVENSTLDFFVGYDYECAGYSQAKMLLAKAPEGNFILLGGREAEPESALLRAGQLRAIEEHRELAGKTVTILADPFLERADYTEAREKILNMMKLFRSENIELHAVLAPDDQTAGGVIAALEELGLAGRVAVAGLGAELDACRRLVKGTQAVTILASGRELGAVAAEVCVRLASGETPAAIETGAGLRLRYLDNGRRPIPSFLLAPSVVTRETLPRTVLRDQLYSAEAIYGDNE